MFNGDCENPSLFQHKLTNVTARGMMIIFSHSFSNSVDIQKKASKFDATTSGSLNVAKS